MNVLCLAHRQQTEAQKSASSGPGPHSHEWSDLSAYQISQLCQAIPWAGLWANCAHQVHVLMGRQSGTSKVGNLNWPPVSHRGFYTGGGKTV